MINGPFYTYRRMHFTSGHASFCDICLCVCLSVCLCVCVCLSVTYLAYLLFTQYWNAVESLFFPGCYPLR